MGKTLEKKPRILMIAPLPPPVHGSAMMTQYIKDSKLINDNFNLDWVNLSTSRSMDEIGKHSLRKISRLGCSLFKTLILLLFHKYVRAYIAITCHGGGFLKDMPFALLCKLFGLKLIIHQHNKGMSRDVNKTLFRFLLKAVYKNSEVILLSERLYPDISEIVDHEQVVICPNGIPEVERLPHSPNPIPKLLFLSNLIESKGVFILLDACKILKDKGYVFICDFIGGETKEVSKTRFEEEVKKRGLDDMVIYLGSKYGKDKATAIAESDSLVFPTFYENETFGLVLLEAMQQAIPQISTPTGGIPDIIENGKTGMIIPVKDSQKLADAITYLIDKPEIRAKMGEEAYNRFKELYTLNKFEEAISSILGGTAPNLARIGGGGYLVN